MEPFLSEKEIKLVREDIAKELNPTQFEKFLYVCEARQLNPLLGHIMPSLRAQKDKNGQWLPEKRMTIIVQIDGFLFAAGRTGEVDGIEQGISRTEHGDVYGYARVWKKNCSRHFYKEVALSEYNTKENLWISKPETMIMKVALSHVLRLAFPEALGGLYTPEEMGTIGPISEKEFDEIKPAIEKKEDDDKELKYFLGAMLELVKKHNIQPEEFADATGISSIRDIKTAFIMENAILDMEKWLITKGRVEEAPF